MDVHPTKNVSIGIDPSPYVRMWLGFFFFDGAKKSEVEIWVGEIKIFNGQIMSKSLFWFRF